jgi:phage/plasmid-like protein (TIGR03299 family)
MDWSVRKTPLFLKDQNGDMQVTNDSFGVIRDIDNRYLGTVGPQWEPIQPSSALAWFQPVIDSGSCTFETAGSLRDGKMVWAMAQIKNSFELFGGDKVEGYLLFSNPHEFGRSIDIRFTPVRVVCNNTLTMALDENAKHAVKLNHRSQFNGDQVKMVLGIAGDRLSRYKEQAQFLGKKKYNKETIVEYFNRVFPSMTKDEVKLAKTSVPISRHAEEAMGIVHTQPGAKFAEGSWWQAFNAVTYMTDHKLGRSRDSRLTSAWYGLNRAKKEKALELAVKYAEMA